jgi:hypothetical protein
MTNLQKIRELSNEDLLDELRFSSEEKLITHDNLEKHKAIKAEVLKRMEATGK